MNKEYYFNKNSVVPPFGYWEKNPDYNIYRFYFDGDYGSARSNWYGVVNAQFTGSTWHTPVPLWAIVTSFGAGIDIFGTAPGHGYALLSAQFHVFDSADFL